MIASIETLQIVQLIITAVVGFLTVAVGLWFNYKTKILELTAKQVAERQEADSKKTDVKLKAIEETGDKIHVLVNAPMAAALLLAKVTTRRLADLNPNDPADEAIAQRAENDYNAHIKRQDEADEAMKKKTDHKAAAELAKIERGMET